MNDIRKNDIVLALLFVTETSQEYKKQPSEVFYLKKAVFKNFANFTGKHLSWSIFLLKPATLLKRDSSTGVFW